MADFVAGFVLGVVTDIVIGVMTDLLKTIVVMIFFFHSRVRYFEKQIKSLESLIEESWVDDQTEELKKTTQRAKEVLNNCMIDDRGRLTRNIFKRFKYVRKIRQLSKTLGVFLPYLELRYQKEILELAKTDTSAAAESSNDDGGEVSKVSDNGEVDVAAAPTSANDVVSRLEMIEANMADLLKVNVELIRQLSQSRLNEVGGSCEEIKCHCTDVHTNDTITEEDQNMSQFRGWIGDPIDGWLNLESCETSKKWFVEMMTPGEWLSDMHVDAFLYFLRKSRQYHSPSLIQSCAILNTEFWDLMSWQWPTFQNNRNLYEWDSKILAYPLGNSPEFTPPWSEVDDLYIPASIEDHRVAVRIELMRRKLTIYDSTKSANENESMRNSLTPLATMLPSLLIRSGFYENRQELSPLKIPFQIVLQAESVPDEAQSGDCGIFVLKFVEFLSSGKEPSFKDKDISALREEMAFQLFDMGHA